jgi:sugar phosphate isomerase/epimerase
MRLGIGSYTYPWAVGVPGLPPDRPLSALQLLDRAVELGVGLVQLCDNLPMSPADIERVAERAGALGLGIELGTRGIVPAHLRQQLARAVRLKSPFLRVVVDTADEHPSPQQVVAALSRLMPAFEAARVSLAIENHDRFPSSVLRSILDQIDSPRLGICLDTANSLGCLEDLGTVLDVLADRVLNIHIKDVSARRVGSNLGFVIEGRPAGQGQVDLPGLLRRFRDATPQPSLTLEQWAPWCDDLDQTIAQEAQWACWSIEYLRALTGDITRTPCE